MGGHSFPSTSETKKESNLQRLLDSLTPNVPLKPIPENCIQSLNSEWNTSEKPITEYFMLRDLWKCFKEWSAYGRGTEVILPNGKTVWQYFTPYLSALQISINKRIQKVDSVANGSCNGTKSLSAENKCTELFRSSSNTSGNSKFWNSSSGSYSSTDPERKEVCLFKHHFEFHDDQNPYTRVPFFDKIQNLAKEYPGLRTLRSTDLLPSSWMAVAWYPIYHIPPDKGFGKDLSAAFITFHTLSSFHQDTGVDPAGEKAGIGGSRAVVIKKGTKIGQPKMRLPPFGLAALYLTGDVWFISGQSDEEKYNDLYNAASSWLKKRHFYHHDFNFFTNKSRVRGI